VGNGIETPYNDENKTSSSYTQDQIKDALRNATKYDKNPYPNPVVEIPERIEVIPDYIKDFIDVREIIEKFGFEHKFNKTVWENEEWESREFTTKKERQTWIEIKLIDKYALSGVKITKYEARNKVEGLYNMRYIKRVGEPYGIIDGTLDPDYWLIIDENAFIPGERVPEKYTQDGLSKFPTTDLELTP